LEFLAFLDGTEMHLSSPGCQVSESRFPIPGHAEACWQDPARDPTRGSKPSPTAGPEYPQPARNGWNHGFDADL